MIDDLTVIKFEKIQRDPSLGQLCRESMLLDGSIPSLFALSNKKVTTHAVKEDPPPVTVSFRFPIAPAPVAVVPAAAPALLPPAAVVASPISWCS